MKHKKTNRVGETRVNSYGSKMTIIQYNRYDDMLVRFEHGDTVKTRWYDFNQGSVKSAYDRSVYGVGYFGEGDYVPTADNIKTPMYKSWYSMMSRCYKKRNSNNYDPTYLGVSVCSEWHNYQNFATWYVNNYYNFDETLSLDKDILSKGSKIYSPSSCVFVPKRINNLFTKSTKTRGKLPVGVTMRKDRKINRYAAALNVGGGVRKHLGFYESSEKAFQVYKFHKEKLIKDVAEEYKKVIPIVLYNALINYEVEIDD